MLRQVFAFVVREEAFFGWKIHDEIAGEIQVHLFGIDFYFRLREGGFQAISGAFVVDAKDDRVSAVHVQAQFFVVLADLCEFLADHRFKGLVAAAFLGLEDFRFHAKLFVIDVEGEGTILQQGAAIEKNVVTNAAGGANSDFDFAVGGAQVVAGLRRYGIRRHEDRYRDKRKCFQQMAHERSFRRA